MNVKNEETRVIGGMPCINKRLAAERVGMKASAFNRFLAMQKAGRTKVKIKFFQPTKGSTMWFPIEFVDSFVLQVMEKGGAY